MVVRRDRNQLLIVARRAGELNKLSDGDAIEHTRRAISWFGHRWIGGATHSNIMAASRQTVSVTVVLSVMVVSVVFEIVAVVALELQGRMAHSTLVDEQRAERLRSPGSNVRHLVQPTACAALRAATARGL